MQERMAERTKATVLKTVSGFCAFFSGDLTR
jgi:hypothetical protein